MKKRIYQTDTSSKTGNCLPACIASMFDFPLESIPNFILSGRYWRQSYYEFLRNNNIGVIFIPVTGKNFKWFLEANQNLETYCICSVESFTHKDVLHAVVGRLYNGVLEVIHDPNPNNVELADKEYRVQEIDLFFSITAENQNWKNDFRLPA